MPTRKPGRKTKGICIRKTKMKDKTFRLSWPEWQEYCAEHGLDPRKQREDGRDLGGGNSITFECQEDPPEEDD